jgi:hypothetical protein
MTLSVFTLYAPAVDSFEYLVMSISKCFLSDKEHPWKDCECAIGGEMLGVRFCISLVPRGGLVLDDFSKG